MKKGIMAVILVFIVSFTLLAGGKTESKQPEAKKPTYLLRFGHVQTSEDLFHKAYEKWAKAINEKTKGDLLIEVYPSAQLGVEEDVLEQMRKGTNVGWQTDPARLGNYVKEFSIFYAPYFLDNLEEVKKLLTSKTIGEWIKKLEDQFQIKVISYAWVQGYRNVFSNKMGKNPAEFRGMLIRTAPAPMWVATINSLGCKAVALPYGDLYNGIQTKIVDGCELPYAAAVTLKIHEVAKYILETQHIFQVNVQVVSAEWFNKLPKEYQNLLIEECNKAGLEVSETLQKNAEADKQFLISKGMTYIPYKDMDIAAFKKSGQTVYESMQLTSVRDTIYNEIGKTVPK
jgi:TRAP-type C4-dicarboxylate transport system substrate-binding protein